MSDSPETQPLLQMSPDEYGPSYRQHLFDQYKLYVDSTDRISDRRSTANKYFLTINTSLVTLYVLAASFGDDCAWRVVVPIAGVVLGATWYVLIGSYRNLNAAKFEIIHELERQMPAAIFAREWSIVGPGRIKAYWSVSRTESCVAVICCILYVILAGYAVFAPRRADVDQANTTTMPASGPAVQSVEASESRMGGMVAQRQSARPPANLSLQVALARGVSCDLEEG